MDKPFHPDHEGKNERKFLNLQGVKKKKLKGRKIRENTSRPPWPGESTA